MQEEADRRNKEDLTEDVCQNNYAGRWWDRKERKIDQGLQQSRKLGEVERERNKNDARRECHKRTARQSDEEQGRSRQGEMATEQLGVRSRTEPPSRQRGENIRGTGCRGSVATGSNREDDRVQIWNTDQEMEVIEVDTESMQEEEENERKDDLPTPSQLNAMVLPT
jgi:hypothetical protein